MASLIYSTGTIATENGTLTVTGTGTGWAVELIRYGMLSVDGLAVPITSVEDDTHLTIAYPFPGSTGAGKPYAIYLNSDQAGSAVWTNRQQTDIIQRLSLVGIHPDGSGTLAERDALDPAPAPGYMWLYCEPGNDLTISRKTAAGWDGPFAIRGGAGGVGAAATIGIAGVETVGPDDPATVINVGTPSAAMLAFQVPQGVTGNKGDTGDIGPVGPAYESYAVSIYKADGIGAGGYYADRRANANSVQDTVYVEVIDGDVGAEIDLYLEVGGVMAYGPVTVAPGAPVTAIGLAIPVAQAAAVNWVVASVIGGVVRDVFAKSYGALA